MKEYYIIRKDGSSVFELPYREEFIYHCLIKLLDRTDEPLRLLCIDEAEILASVQRDRGKGDQSPLLAFLELGKQNLYT